MTIDFALGLIVGVCLGFVITAEWAWRKFLSKPPTIELKADRKAVESIAAANIVAWLDSHGMVMLPKGPDFQAKVKR